MATAAEFLSRFDDTGRYKAGGGDLAVEVLAAAGTRVPATLKFADGLCVRVEMPQGGAWHNSNNTPLYGAPLRLYFDGAESLSVRIDGGRIHTVVPLPNRSDRRTFLSNLRLSRSLFAAPEVEADNGPDPRLIEHNLARGALWLTPKTVQGFGEDLFTELPERKLQELASNVRRFERIARQVPPEQAPPVEQAAEAKTLFRQILGTLNPYLPSSAEERKVENAIDSIRPDAFPDWVLDWNLELESDEEGRPAVRINLFVDNEAPRPEFGRAALGILPKVREKLLAEGIDRWPYIRIRATAEQRAL